MKMNRVPYSYRLLTSIGLLLFLILSLILFLHRVDNSLTEEDKRYVPKYPTSIPTLAHKPSFKDELKIITTIQDSVLSVAPINEGLPYNTEREPKDLYLALKGLCYDGSRVIENILRYTGFQTRHTCIYSTPISQSAFLLRIN